MDIGLIVLFIVISIVGNIIKESRKQGQNRNTRQGDDYRPPSKAPVQGYRPPRRNYQPVKNAMPGRYDVPGPAPAKSVEEDFSLEGKRADIGRTYESQDMPSYREERASLEGTSLENVEVDHISYEQEDGTEKAVPLNGDGFSNVPAGGAKIVFSSDTLIHGIIMSEVLSPPKCRR